MPFLLTELTKLGKIRTGLLLLSQWGLLLVKPHTFADKVLGRLQISTLVMVLLRIRLEPPCM